MTFTGAGSATVGAGLCAAVVASIAVLAAGAPVSIVVVAAAGVGSVVGVVTGFPVAVIGGAAGMIGGYGLAIGTSSTASGGVASFVVAVALWFHVELSIRSLELRPSITASRAASVAWSAATVAVMIGIVAMWLAVDAVERSAPSGGLLFRLLAVAAVAVMAVALSAIMVRTARARRSPR